jgi:hypothetical protein
MSRLRHPVRAIREPFGKAGLTVAILALVMAMVGGAYAAGALSGKQKKEVEKIAKKFQGTGPAGAAGANGTPGANGKDGANGQPGAPGKAGESVTIAAAGGSECEGHGGTKFSNGTGSGTACNGTTGFTETLPEGKTETGIFSTTYFTSGEPTDSGFSAPISFPIPLFTGPQTEVLEFPNKSANCPVSGLLEAGPPQAKPGFLCIYEFSLTNATNHGVPKNFETFAAGAATYGTVLSFSATAAGRAEVNGVWAVTEAEG